MLVRRKERDVKFIIYQSLYIFVIATLGFHGLNLYDITKIPPKKVGDTTISKVNLDSLKSKIPADSLSVHITQDSINELLNRVAFDPDREMIVNKSELQGLRNNQRTNADRIRQTERVETELKKDPNSEEVNPKGKRKKSQ